MLTTFINRSSHSALVRATKVVLEGSLPLNALSVHIGLVDLAPEALVGGQSHAEVSNLNVEELEDRDDEGDCEEQE